MNRFYERFDGPKWIDFTEANYLTGNDYFSMIIFGAITSPKFNNIDLISFSFSSEMMLSLSFLAIK